MRWKLRQLAHDLQHVDRAQQVDLDDARRLGTLTRQARRNDGRVNDAPHVVLARHGAQPLQVGYVTFNERHLLDQIAEKLAQHRRRAASGHTRRRARRAVPSAAECGSAPSRCHPSVASSSCPPVLASVIAPARYTTATRDARGAYTRRALCGNLAAYTSHVLRLAAEKGTAWQHSTILVDDVLTTAHARIPTARGLVGR